MLKQKKVAGMLGVMMVALGSLSASNVKPNGCEGPVLCPIQPIADRCEDCCYSWQVDIGLLYQQPGFAYMNSGIAYQPVFQNPTSGGLATAFIDQTVTLLDEQYDYSVGLTVGIGRTLKHDNWFVGVNFDWLNATGSSVHNDDNLLYRPSSDFPLNILEQTDFLVADGSFGKVVYSANTNIYELNVRLSRGSYNTNCYSLEPYAGVKALWFNNSQTKKYQEPSADINSRVSLKSTQDNWGAGIMFGMNGEYSIVEGFSIFSDSNVGVLYGQVKYNMLAVVTAESAGSNIFTEDRDLTNNGKMDTVTYVPVRSILGVKFSKYFLDKTHHVALKVGYDARAVLSTSKDVLVSQNWFPTGDFATTQVKNIDNSFSMSGLYIDLCWGF